MNPASVPTPLPPPGQQVIHVTQDLDTDLEALFNSVMNPKPSSWRKKILPESFFKEPDSGSHSRQSSTDSSGSHPARLSGGGGGGGGGGVVAGGAQHVRSHSSPASLQLGTGAGAAASAAQQHAHLRQQSYDVTDELPLPPGWEMTFTATGQRYFLNHIEKITTWQDPRKTMTQPLNHMALHPSATSTPMPQRSMAMSQPNLVMNHQHQQQMTSNTTLSQQNHPAPNPQAGLMSLPNALTTQQQQQQKLRLQRIQMERERIRMRQEELMRQEAALCRQLPMESETMASVQATGNTPAMAQEIRPITNNSSDPFLNGEQSTDSGLGLGCYSIPTTPEDFLGNVDEMDTGENVAQTPMNLNAQQTRFPDFLDCLPGTNVDLGTLESEDLIPIFNDVESVLTKSEPFLTWL
ncbi:WW domain-containing transcription regulator protein 1 isoform X2 [Monodelphis domestica]|uniref:WW domain-containing transcription regulator protein 1 isoform X2 n=1 Tax=Monodelphis domestica TaxID=13616 RepID=UPI0024E26F9C|nr:WW domain-containing transcription regulator protein 1 isoform X2 [Monodelphis domestica]